MFKVRDTITGDILTYEDAEDFRNTAKYSFDESVHGVVDKLVDAYERGDNWDGLDTYLGIEIL